MQSPTESVNNLVDDYASGNRWSKWLPQPVSVILSSLVFGWLAATAYPILGQPVSWPLWLGLSAVLWTGALMVYLARTR